MMELLRPAVPGCSDSLGVHWLGGHGRTLCAQAAGQGLPMGGGHTHTAEETAPGGPTRLGWQDQVRDTLGGEV